MAKLRLGEIIGERDLHVVGSPERRVVVRVGRPVKKRGGDWHCAFQIDGLGDSHVERAFGVDSMQALQLALYALQVSLANSGEELLWVSDDLGTGFERSIPMLWPRRYAAMAESEIDRVWRLKVNAETRQIQRRQKQQAAKRKRA